MAICGRLYEGESWYDTGQMMKWRQFMYGNRLIYATTQSNCKISQRRSTYVILGPANVRPAIYSGRPTPCNQIQGWLNSNQSYILFGILLLSSHDGDASNIKFRIRVMSHELYGVPNHRRLFVEQLVRTYDTCMRWPLDSPHRGSVMRKLFSSRGVLMTTKSEFPITHSTQAIRPPTKQLISLWWTLYWVIL